jgi:hypothetical protein
MLQKVSVHGYLPTPEGTLSWSRGMLIFFPQIYDGWLPGVSAQVTTASRPDFAVNGMPVAAQSGQVPEWYEI